MMMHEVIAILQRNPLFRRLGEDRLRFVVLSAAEEKLSDGEVLFERGDEGDAAYVVLTGTVTPRIRVDGREFTVARLGPGELFGEVAVLCNRPRTASIVAEGPTTIIRLGADELRDLLIEFPELAMELIRSLAARLEKTSLDLVEARAMASRV
jgi:CRP-like cAMP-binding protein